MSAELPFEPFRILKGSHRQTILGSVLHLRREPPSETEYVRLPDNDKIALEITTPKGWKPTDPTAVLLHGLCGSHRSPYLVRMTHKLSRLGIRCVRMNMRGCGSGKGHAREIYHSGRSEDVFEVIKHLHKKNPQSEFVLMGFSLGANIVLKLAGELGSLGTGLLRKVISVSPPADLYSSVKMLHDPDNRFYERYFIRMLRSEVKYRHKKFPELPLIKLPKKMTLFDFDHLYTAPQSGFKTAMDYYEKCSSSWLVPEIEVPAYILFAEDDPIISPTSLDHLPIPSNVKIYKTKNGGHLGFLGSPFSGRYHWMDNILIDWVTQEE